MTFEAVPADEVLRRGEFERSRTGPAAAKLGARHTKTDQDMSPSRLRLGVRLAVVLGAASVPFPVSGKDGVEPPPTDADVKKQIERLDPKKAEAERLDAAKWLGRHAKAKNANLGVPALERCIRTDPAADVRDAAVLGLAKIAKDRDESCPRAIVEAMLDKDVFVSQTADLVADWFKTFPPGSVEVLLRCAGSEDDNRRARSLGHLARAGGKDKQVIEAIEKATKDKSFGVRHNARVALFQATDNLAELLAYFVRLLDDSDSLLSPVDPTSEEGKRERTTRHLVSLGAAMLIVEWSDKRPDDLAPALLKLLESPSSQMRRGAARQIGASAVKVELTGLDGKKEAKVPPEPSKAEKPEPSNVAGRFEKLKAEDRLRDLRDNDPDDTVRAAARVALERLASVRGKGPHR
jgi:HEAT repeat protein